MKLSERPRKNGVDPNEMMRRFARERFDDMQDDALESYLSPCPCDECEAGLAALAEHERAER